MTAPMEFLRSCQFFSGLSDDELMTVASLLSRRECAVGQGLFAYGDKGDSFFLVESGRVRISRQPRQELVTIAEMEAGTVIGEMALISNEVRTADGTAIEPMVAWELTRQRFCALARQEPRLYRAIVRNIVVILCRRLRRATDRVGEVLDAFIEASGERESLKERVNRGRQGLFDFLGALGVD